MASDCPPAKKNCSFSLIHGSSQRFCILHCVLFSLRTLMGAHGRQYYNPENFQEWGPKMGINLLLLLEILLDQCFFSGANQKCFSEAEHHLPASHSCNPRFSVGPPLTGLEPRLGQIHWFHTNGWEVTLYHFLYQNSSQCCLHTKINWSLFTILKGFTIFLKIQKS